MCNIIFTIFQLKNLNKYELLRKIINKLNLKNNLIKTLILYNLHKSNSSTK